VSISRRERFIVHADMDAFFASVEQRDAPELRLCPVIVGSDPKRGKGRGVVSACSYEARKFGIHSAMPISEAYRLCPDGVFLPVNMDRYSEVSEEVYDVFYSFTPDIQPIGIDEAFLDITGSHHLFGGPVETCKRIKAKIKNDIGLAVSIGLAPNKTAAKIASDIEKPDGLVRVTTDGLLSFLHPLPVGKLWGLGKKSCGSLNGMGIFTIGDLAKASPRRIRQALGNSGDAFRAIASGIDDDPVESGGEAKSVSNELTFDLDTANKDKVASALMHLSEKVSSRLREGHIKCRTVTLKIRLEDFTTRTRSFTFKRATNLTDELYIKVNELYNAFNCGRGKVRLVGVRASGLSRLTEEKELFEAEIDKKRESVDIGMDKIKMRFGNGSIYRASSKGA